MKISAVILIAVLIVSPSVQSPGKPSRPELDVDTIDESVRSDLKQRVDHANSMDAGYSIREGPLPGQRSQGPPRSQGQSNRNPNHFKSKDEPQLFKSKDEPQLLKSALKPMK